MEEARGVRVELRFQAAALRGSLTTAHLQWAFVEGDCETVGDFCKQVRSDLGLARGITLKRWNPAYHGEPEWEKSALLPAWLPAAFIKENDVLFVECGGFDPCALPTPSEGKCASCGTGTVSAFSNRQLKMLSSG